MSAPRTYLITVQHSSGQRSHWVRLAADARSALHWAQRRWPLAQFCAVCMACEVRR